MSSHPNCTWRGWKVIIRLNDAKHAKFRRKSVMKTQLASIGQKGFINRVTCCFYNWRKVFISSQTRVWRAAKTVNRLLFTPWCIRVACRQVEGWSSHFAIWVKFHARSPRGYEIASCYLQCINFFSNFLRNNLGFEFFTMRPLASLTCIKNNSNCGEESILNSYCPSMSIAKWCIWDLESLLDDLEQHSRLTDSNAFKHLEQIF